MMMTVDYKKDVNKSLKEIQENTGKHVESLKQETQKSLKELQKNTIKQANNIIQDLKIEIQTIKN